MAKRNKMRRYVFRTGNAWPLHVLNFFWVLIAYFYFQQVVDRESYILDLEDANANDNPKWTKLYSAREAYNMESLAPTEWDSFLKKLATDDKALDLYYRFEIFS